MEDKSFSLRTASKIGLLILVIVSQFVQVLSFASNATSSSLVPAVFVFGDSIVDTGNNNGIATIIKSNFPPYGKDFPGHEPTGRFCNGKIPSDFIASRLGLKELVPAYLGTHLKPEDMLTGVSFASSGSGYDPLTPIIVSVISMPSQLKLFKEYKERLIAMAGEEKAGSIISQGLYITCAGSDDLANTYFTSPFRMPYYDIPSYVNLMVSSAASFLKKLVKLGARKIGFVGVPPIGCIPSQRTLAGGILRDCEASRNEAAQLFNSKMKKRIEMFTNESLEGTVVLFLDIYPLLLDLIQRPFIYGFEESSKGCCGTGELEVAIFCNNNTASICEDDTKYVFWDSYHPTERAYQILVNMLFKRYLKSLF